MVAKNAKKITYDNKLYESKMYYANVVTRTKLYEHDVVDDFNEGVDHCYDCASEIHIIKQYVIKTKNKFVKITNISEFMYNLSNLFSPYKHLNNADISKIIIKQ